ncbi:MAG: 2-C-methyl-D-erythritol 4-phosphate cytidylyltransferase [Geobacter sp.]
MINGKTVLAIIPARGGSKGVPRKNIRELAGKPLIAWSIEAAKKSQYIDRIVISTDDQEIAEVATQWGGEVPFFRPAELAQDNTPGIAPVLHMLDNLKPSYDLVVLLQPTSPLRTVEDIDGVIALLDSNNAKSCVSVVTPNKSPYWMYTIEKDGNVHPVLEGDYSRRQDLPSVYALNGAVYAADVAWLHDKKTFLDKQTLAYIMTKERSIDIDYELDFKFVELVMQENVRP